MMHRYLKILLLACMALWQTALAAQGVPTLGSPGADAVVDLEPPLIEHDVVNEAEADIRQSFVATVVDDEELTEVLLYYRFSGETSYSRYRMMQVSFSSTYIAQIPTDPTNLTAIEYFIQARDTSGNRTVRGYTFSPLVRQIVKPQIAEAQGEETAAEGAGQTETAWSNMPKAVYVVGGVLLLGLVASAASGGSDSGPPNDGGDCGSAGCRLTITVNPPFE